ncbi:MAG TPA: LytTR family DNA-binding domain-containing protein [Chitinophagaceae bacterium]|nr:LytTR family DNA-binding domain-containing protein [Chitinophagaceae bacterium]
MRILIIEDEEAAVKRLQKMLKEIAPESEVIDSLVSIKSSVQWFKSNPQPDLILMDVHLADGLSFEILRQISIECPVIFTTAYDKYALEAFKLNTVDYLLKPVKKEELQNALAKFKKHQQKTTPAVDIDKIINSFQKAQQEYKKRFVVRYGEHIKTINTGDAAYFYTEARANFMVTKDAKRYVIDYNLDQLETLLDPKVFYRINRQFIIGIDSIDEMLSYSKSRVLIKLNPPCKIETIVSTERSGDFKQWLGGE